MQPAAAPRVTAPQARGLALSLQIERKQRAAALAALDDARQQLAQHQVTLPTKRVCSGRADGGQLMILHPIRFGQGGRVDAFGHEMTRRLVEECGMTFEAAATANNIILTWHLRATPPGEMLITSQYVAKAFERLGQLDLADQQAFHQALPKNWPWAAAADAGNKGREIDMIAISIWSALRQKPVMRSLAAADLHGDGTGKNLSNTLRVATDRSGLHPEGCVQGCTDGASACSGKSGETELFLSGLRERAAADVSALVHSATKETCCIHAKVLEENRGMEAAFPGTILVNFTRLLWECFSTTGALPHLDASSL